MREGDAVGGFTVGPLLGKGGMATVHLGTYAADGTRVAIKVLRPEIAQQADFVAAFGHEVRAAAGLNHERITAIYDHGVVTEAEAGDSPEYAGVPWLAMELVEGTTLRSVAGTLPWRDIARIVTEVLDGLAHAHARGLIHRDIKPGNVLLDTRTRRVKLTDFGLVHSVAYGQTAQWAVSDDVSGTPAYMAPEQAQNHWFEYGPWTDLYAVGCMTWALVCGGSPYRGTVGEVFRKHLRGQLPDFMPRTSVPSGLLEWLRGMLDPLPRFRFQRAADARWHFQALTGEAVSPAATAPLSATAPNQTDTLILTDETAPLLTPTDGHGANAHGLDSDVEPTPRSRLPRVFSPLAPDWRTTQRPRTHLHGAGLALFSLRSTGLVGREAERDQLWAALHRVASRSTAECVVIEGPAGSGTSALADWLTVRADETSGVKWRRITHGTATEATDGLRSFLGWSLRVHHRARADALDAVHAHLKAIGMPHRDDAIALLEIARPTPLDELGDGLSAHFESPTERLALVGRYFAALAADRPLILWLDDAHHDPETCELVARLLDHHRDIPILVVMTTATEAAHDDPAIAEQLNDLLQRPSASHVVLPPLDSDGSVALIRELLGLDLVLAARVAQQCGGNPQFAVQLVADWVERGLLRPAPSGFALAPDADASVPSTMLAMWRQRLTGAIEGYSDADTAALELGAILGNDVSREEWLEAMERAGVVPNDHLMSDLERKRLIINHPKTGGWSFVHALFRAALMERVEHHGRTRQWSSIAADTMPSAPQHVGRKARFLMAANRTEEALEPLYRTVVRLARLGEYARARHLLTVRQELMQSLPIGPRSPEALGSAVAALMVAERDGRYAVLQQHGPAHIAWARACSDWEAVALLQLEYGNSFYALGQVGACTREMLLGLSVARRQRLPWVSAILTRMCFLAIRSGDLDEAASRAREAVYAAEVSGDLLAVGTAYGMLSRVAWQRGDNEAAKFFNAEATLRFQRTGSRLGLAEAGNTEGEIARALGDHEAAERAYIDAAARYRRSGSTYFVYPEINLAMTYIGQRRFAEARTILTEVNPVLRSTGRDAIALVVRLWLTGCTADDGDWPRVRSELRALGPALTQAGIVDSDIVRAGRLVAGQSEAANRSAEAALAWGIVLHQLDRLGKTDEARAIRARIAD